MFSFSIENSIKVDAKPKNESDAVNNTNEMKVT